MDDLRFLDPDSLVNRAAFNERFEFLNGLAFGLGNQYLWGVNRKIVKWTTGTKYNSNFTNVGGTDPVRSYYYGDDFTANPETGKFTIVDPTYVEATSSTWYQVFNSTLKGKYFVHTTDGSPGDTSSTSCFYIPENATITSQSAGAYGIFVVVSEWQTLTNPVYASELTAYVNSSDPNAYPPTEPDGFEYVPLGQVGSKVRIATGSYVGTGMYGASNPNSLTFDFEPKLIALTALSYLDSTVQWFGRVESGSYGLFAVYPYTLTVDFKQNCGFSVGITPTLSYGRFFDKTYQWYSTRHAGAQGNETEYIYYYLAIG